MEKEIRLLLIKENINFIEQCSKKDGISWVSNQSLDFYLPDYNAVIECQGEQHFKPVNFGGKNDLLELKAFEIICDRDKRKYENCANNGIRIYYYTNKIEFINGPYLDIVYTNKNDLINKIKIDGKEGLL